MAEILIRVVDKEQPDVALDPFCGKRGDVIAVCPDGWSWGLEELSLPFYRILTLPGVSVESLQDLVEPEFAGSVVVRKRAKRVDIDALPAAIRSQLTGVGARGIGRIAAPGLDLRARVVVKTPAGQV